jgi:teichuronic acid biosynthesis glycosyltransferase TuaC
MDSRRPDSEGPKDVRRNPAARSSELNISLASEGRHPPKVLFLSRSYPNSATELLGLWVERLVRHSTRFCQPKVVSPVPYCPPFPGLPESYARFRQVERHVWNGGIEVFHPRLIVGPGYSLYNAEWMLYYAAIRKLVERLRRSFPFDLIHAHFTYPDGVVAVHLGRRYGVPVIITEHVPWHVWTDKYARVRRWATRAARQCVYHVSVSEFVRQSVEQVTGARQNLVVIPNGVDGSMFTTSLNGHGRVPGQILFAGAVRPIKGVDILLKSMRLLADRGIGAKLVLVGEAYYRAYRQEEARLQQMVSDLGLRDRVRFVGKKTPSELVSYMQESVTLVLPSRAESFGMVLVEALACGTPVVATRCGGPEEIVNEQVGVLVPPEDPEALARGIEHVLEHGADYDPTRLRAHALENFGLDSVGRRLEDLYQKALDRFQQRPLSNGGHHACVSRKS